MVELLRCPHCHLPLHRSDASWRCRSGHVFDVARQGYVNLTAGRSRHGGDTAAMLDARAAVLRAGHLDVVTDAVTDACRGAPASGVLVEVGAGTAHHLGRVCRALGQRPAVAIDVSVAAAKRAARADPAITAVVADAWQPWPLVDEVAAAVLVVFAPRNLPEAARVLVPGGRLVVVTPAADHLAELVEALGLLRVDPHKAARVAAEGRQHLRQVASAEVRTTAHLTRDEARAVAAMGPSAHHLDAAELLARTDRLAEHTSATIAVDVTTFERRRWP